MYKYNSLFINSIHVQSSSKPMATVDFRKKIKFITGDSNAGKSFLVSIIYFILGKEELIENEELKSYQTCIMHFNIGLDKYSAFRDIDSDRFFIYSGFIFDKDKGFLLKSIK